MTNFDGLGGKVKTDFDPKWQNLEPQKHELTNPATSDPHFIRYSVTRLPTVEEVQKGKKDPIEVATWVTRHPTRDAADSHATDIRVEMKHMRGEPEQAWADVARLSKCPNPVILAKFKNLAMELIPAPQPKPEPIPRDHPAYPNSFAAKRDAVTGQPHPESVGASTGSPAEAGGGPDGGRPKKVRSRAPSGAATVQPKRRGGKTSKSKAKQSPKKASRRG